MQLQPTLLPIVLKIVQQQEPGEFADATLPALRWVRLPRQYLTVYGCALNFSSCAKSVATWACDGPCRLACTALWPARHLLMEALHLFLPPQAAADQRVWRDAAAAGAERRAAGKVHARGGGGPGTAAAAGAGGGAR